MKPKFMLRMLKIYVMIAYFLLLTNCQKDVEFPTFINQGEVGAQGGIVKTSDGASIEIPPGTLISLETISITNITEGDTALNGGCAIYELKPDGLNFSDSVIITFPFNDKYVDLSSTEENFGIGIMVLQNNEWIKLKTEIDLQSKTAKAKTTHFSNYRIYFPYIWSAYYLRLKNSPDKIMDVPYYEQEGNWCAYYSLSMVTKYAGYNHKAPYFASLLGETTTDFGFTRWDFPALANNLKNIGISAKIAFPSWTFSTDLAGYVLKQLNDGFPVWFCNKVIGHAWVVTGHNQSGFYLNDPDDSKEVHFVSYEDFINGNFSWWDIFGPIISGENTLVVTSLGDGSRKGLTLNFHSGDIWITQSSNSTGTRRGMLWIDGKFKPKGYSLTNSSGIPISFDGSNYIHFYPKISNSNLSSSVSARLYIRIDNANIAGSPITLSNIPAESLQYYTTVISSSLSNLTKGKHEINVELRSTDYQILYDSWSFDLNIENEYLNTFTDSRDGHIYKYVNIGTQTWMAENLAYLPSVTPSSSGSTSGVRYYVNGFQGTNVSDAKATPNYQTYGVLYNWPAANNGCPSGWHLPSNSEFATLANYLGGDNLAGGKLKEAGTTHWNSPNTGATNETGFTALPGGVRLVDGTFGGPGLTSYLWSSTLINTYPTYYGRDFIYNSASFPPNDFNADHGLSVRCIKN